MNSKKYELNITRHGRERWVERVVNPKHYTHLSKCDKDSCRVCTSMLYDIRRTIEQLKRGIDGNIVSAWRQAEKQNAVTEIKDYSFLEAIKKNYGDLNHLRFLKVEHKDAVLVVLQSPEDETPTLVTVLKQDMIDGTIFRTFEGQELTNVFQRWKFEARQSK